MPIQLPSLSFQTLLSPILILSLGLATAAYGEKGGNGIGNGNANSHGHANGNGNNQGNGHGPSAANPGLTAAQASTAGANTPQNLNAYKAAYLKMLAATAQAEIYQGQYQQIAAMTEAEFKATYPTGDYQATLAHLAAQYQAYDQQRAEAAEEAAQRLNFVTNGQPLSAERLAELQQMLGL